jgi:hypothetical protein
MQSLERAEQLARVIHVEADPVVANEEDSVAVGGPFAVDRDLRRIAVGAELPCVAHQVVDHQLQQPQLNGSPASAGRRAGRSRAAGSGTFGQRRPVLANSGDSRGILTIAWLMSLETAYRRLSRPDFSCVVIRVGALPRCSAASFFGPV